MKMHETFIKPMHPEGLKFVAAFAVVAAILFWLWQPLGWIGVGLTVWCYYFFRDPIRHVPQGADLMVSPADGIISLIEMAVPPPELGMGPQSLLRVSVFMNVFNVHINRAPVAGRVVKMAYHPGAFLNASLDKASELNERAGMIIETADGIRVGVVQIAGLVARRIMPFTSENQMLALGERFGLIRFGSRVDVYLPTGVAPMVALGQTMIAGETVMAQLGSDAPRRLAEAE